MNKTNKGELIDLGSIAIIFLAAVLIGGPQGNFPLNDDWSFALTTQRLVSDHLWRPTGWTSMPLVTHAVWGAVFCEAAGHCTSQTLRAANIAAAVVALISTYLLGREAGLSRTHRLMLVALFGANPIFFALSFTFMTDITFVALAMLAALFFGGLVKNHLHGNLVWAVMAGGVFMFIAAAALMLVPKEEPIA